MEEIEHHLGVPHPRQSSRSCFPKALRTPFLPVFPPTRTKKFLKGLVGVALWHFQPDAP